MAGDGFFTWGAGGTKRTPEQIARQREIANALIGKGIDTSPVGHWTQGLARVAQSAAGAYGNWQLDEQEEAGMARGKAAMDPVLAALIGSGGASAGGYAGSAPQTAAGATAALASVPSGDQASYIRQGLIARGLPEHVADGFLLNFQDESGLNSSINEANPIVPGSRGGYGLYQLTGPRRVAYEQYAQGRGVDPSNVDAQLDFMISELQGPEADAARSIFSAPDAGSAAAAIVTDFLRPAEEHRNRRVASYTGGAGLQQGVMAPRQTTATVGMGIPNADGTVGGSVTQQPGGYSVYDPLGARTQVASLDPTVGAPAGASPALGYAPQPGGIPAQAPLTSDPAAVIAAELANGGAAGQSGAPTAEQQIAQLIAPAPAPAQTNLLPLLLNASADPWARQQYGGTIDMLLQNELQQRAQASDPLRQLQIQAAQQGLTLGELEIQSQINPKAQYGFMTMEDGTLIRTDATSGTINPLSQYAEPPKPAPPAPRPMTADERTLWGIPTNDTTPYYLDSTGQPKALEVSGGQTDAQINLAWRAAQAGLQPGTKAYSDFMLSGGTGPQVVNNVGANGQEFAAPPFGMDYRRNSDGSVAISAQTGLPEIVQIPNGPQAREAAQAVLDAKNNADKAGLAEGQRDTVTDTITSTAQSARDLIGVDTTGPGGWVLKNLPFSDAADLGRYVQSLKSIAASENIQTMRAASPTGAALGNSSDADLKLLQDKAGALDPSSSRFPQMLDDYERTLLRIVHGYEAGDRIFEATRPPPDGAAGLPPAQSQANPQIYGQGAPPLQGTTTSGVQWSIAP